MKYTYSAFLFILFSVFGFGRYKKFNLRRILMKNSMRQKIECVLCNDVGSVLFLQRVFGV